MSVALLLLALVMLWWHFGAAGTRPALMLAVLTAGAYTVAFTELLSVFGWLTPLGIGIGWLLLVLWTALQRLQTAPPHYRLATHIVNAWATFRADRALALYIGGITLLLMLTGVGTTLAPVNNWDSMTYHLPRVFHWLQNASVQHYPTHIPRQLYQGPYAEFVILHTVALTGTDALANHVQWFSLLISAVGTSLIVRRLGGGSRAGWLAALLTVTVPMALLQATGTQNDLVEAMWLVTLAWAVLRFRDMPSPANAGWVGVALGLAVLTKGTAYTLAFPLMVWFGLATLREMEWATWRPFAIVVVLFFALNSGHYLRNWASFETPLGMAEGYGNELASPAAVASNTLRNLTLNATTPSDKLNYQLFLRPVRWTHNNILGLSLDDPRTTYAERDFAYNYISASEDSAPNPLHFFLAFVVGAGYTVGALRNGHTPRLTWYLLTVIATFVLFSALLKWQIWATRLLTPLFILFVPWMAVVMSRWPRHLVDGIAVLFVLAALPYPLLNCNRPLISAAWPPFTCGRAAVFAPESVTAFNSRLGAREPYLTAANALNDVACVDVGLVLGEDSWEYPIWTLAEGERDFHHINVTNTTTVTPIRPPETVCAVWVSPVLDDDTLTYNGTRYEQAASGGTGPDSAALYLPVTR
jgi:hypothetical protein